MNHTISFGCFTASVLLMLSCTKPKVGADILIENGTVYNGVDAEPKKLSIAIKGDKIIYMGKADSVEVVAPKTIDANGLVVSPGFIDPHTHATADLEDSEKSDNTPFLFQGITTVTVGNDGSSPYPLQGFRSQCGDHGVGTNVVLLVGHGTVRKEVMGKSDRKASAEEIQKMA